MRMCGVVYHMVVYVLSVGVVTPVVGLSVDALDTVVTRVM